jgi:hypothetical protein
MSSTTNGGSRMSVLLGIALIAAVFSGAISTIVLSVHRWAFKPTSFLEVACLSWVAFLVVGIGGAWLLARIIGDPSASAPR